MIPTIPDREIKAGDILFTSNNLISSTLLMEKELPLTVGALLDFCTLIKALTFHDRLIVIPAETGAYEDKRLFKYLKERKMLCAVNRDVVSALDTQFLGDLVGKKISKNQLIREWNIHFGYGYRSSTDSLTERHGRVVRVIIDYKGLPIQSLLDSFDILYGTGRGFRFILRTAIYYALSNHLNLPFLPDFTRIPILLNYNIKVKESLSMMINRKVDEKNMIPLRGLLSIAGYTKIPLPNTVLKFLNMYPQYGLEETLDRIRAEFKGFKKKITEWEHTLIHGKFSTSDAFKVNKSINDSINSISLLSPSDPTDIAVQVGPALFTEILDQSISYGSFGGLAEKSFKFLRKWYRSRNITFFVNAAKEANEIVNEQDLMKLAFGSSLSQHDVARFLSLTQILDNLYDTNTKKL